MNFKPETYERLMKIGTTFSGRLVLSPEVVNLRVIVQDTGRGLHRHTYHSDQEIL